MYVIEMGMWVEKNCIERIEINCPERTLYDHQRSPERTLYDHQRFPPENTA